MTNKQFKAFVDAGGYGKREYWAPRFEKDGHPMSWTEAMAALRDRTGRPGPSTWEVGRYPPGQDDFPVSGVSWYEADAFARFSGREPAERLSLGRRGRHRPGRVRHAVE